MPSQLHEALLLLFRNRPALAPELLCDALHLELPRFREVRLYSADLTDMQPAEYRADLVVLLNDTAASGIETSTLGIVIEVQLSVDDHKRFVWPVYVANLRARLECDVCLLVVAADERVAQWAAKTVEMGGGNAFKPLVLGPSGVPEITDEEQAHADPELAVLSAMTHGNDANIDTTVRIALAAQRAIATLDGDRAKLYYDLVMNSLNEAARRALQTMDLTTYEYQSDFARRYHSQGIAEGRAQGFTEGEQTGEQRGRAALVIRQLGMRFGPLASEVRDGIITAPISELDAIAERLLTAPTLQEALGHAAHHDAEKA
jgi:hypothetical protein